MIDTAYAKNTLDGQWYNFDDSHVDQVDENSVMTNAGYLLFYQRRSSSTLNVQSIIEKMKESPMTEEQQPTNTKAPPSPTFSSSTEDEAKPLGPPPGYDSHINSWIQSEPPLYDRNAEI